MCESSVYMRKNGNEDLILESVDELEVQGDEIRVVNIFGDEKRVKARISKLSLVDHKIYLEPLEE